MATKSFVNVRYDVAKNWRISWNISGSTAPIFAFFTPYERARVARSLDQKKRTKFLRTNKFNVVLFLSLIHISEPTRPY